MQYLETLYKPIFKTVFHSYYYGFEGKTEVRAKINPTESKTFFYRATLKEKEM